MKYSSHIAILTVLAVGTAILIQACVDTSLPDWWEGANPNGGEAVGRTSALEEQTCTAAQLAPAADALKMHFIDVGQGDSIWIQTPTGENILIDAGDGGFFGGRTFGSTFVTAYMSAMGLPPGSAIDTAIVTHAHSDHYGGMINLTKTYQFGNYIDPGLESDNTSYKDLIAKMRNETSNFFRPAVGPDGIVANEGDPLFIFGTEVTAFLLNSEAFLRLGAEPNTRINNTSIVIRLEYAGRSVMLMGDAEQEQELELTQIYSSFDDDRDPSTPGRDLISANILKVGHHGSLTASSTLFLDAAFRNIPNPDERFAIIQSGRQSFSGTTLPAANTVFFLLDSVPRRNLFSTEAGDDAKTETSTIPGQSAPGDDNILSVINKDGSMYTCYVPCTAVTTCNR